MPNTRGIIDCTSNMLISSLVIHQIIEQKSNQIFNLE